MKIIRTAQYIGKVSAYEKVKNPEEGILEGYAAQCDYCKNIYYIDDFQSFDPNLCNGCAEDEQAERAAFEDERPGGAHDMFGSSKSVKTEKYAQEEGISRQRLKTQIYKAIAPITKQFYSDDSWQGVSQVWKAFDNLGLDWNMTEAYYGSGQYDKTMPPQRKTWKFEIRFTNPKGKQNVMYGALVAAGAGSVKDPLDRYDITVNIG